MSKSRAGASLAAFALTGLAVAGLQTGASAAPGDCPTGSHYSPTAGCTTNGASVDHRNFTPGGKGHLRANGFRSGSTAALFVESTPRFLGSFKANRAGVVDANFTLPQSLPAGSHHLVLRGKGEDGAPLVVRVAISVRGRVIAARSLDSSTGSTGGLPYTGSNVLLAGVAGLGLVGAGSGLVLAGRRRAALA